MLRFRRERTQPPDEGRQARAVTAEHTGAMWLREGKVREAMDAFRHALAEDPQRVSAYGFLAQSLVRLGRLEDANREVARGIELAPTDPSMQRTLGMVLEHMGQMHEAIAAYTNAAQLNPEDKETVEALTMLSVRLGNLGAAEEMLEEAVGRDPFDARLLARLSEVRDQRNNVAGAIEAMQWAIGLAPSEADYSYRLGVLLKRQGNLAGAVEAFRAAQDITPDDPTYLEALGQTLIRQSRYADALYLYEQAIRRNPSRRDQYTAVLEELTSRFLTAMREQPPSQPLAMPSTLSSGRPLPRLTDLGFQGAPATLALGTRVGANVPPTEAPRLQARFGTQPPTTLPSAGEGHPHSTGPAPMAQAPDPRNAEVTPPAAQQNSIAANKSEEGSINIGNQAARTPVAATGSIEWYEQAVAADPANSKLHHELSIRYLRAGRLADARREANLAETSRSRRLRE